MSSSPAAAEEEMVLYGFQDVEMGNCHVGDLSPFVVKVMTYLQLRGLPFKALPSSQHNMRGLPRGKVPCLRVGDRLIPDSANIIKELEAQRPEPERMDAWLSPEQLATALAFRKMVEESLYWTAMIHTRWIDDRGWATTSQAYFSNMPVILRPLSIFIRNSTRGQFKGQGHGRRPTEEIHALAIEELTALSTALGQHKYFMGDQCSTVDCTMYAFLQAIKVDIAWYPFCPIREHFTTLKNLVDYVDRMTTRLASVDTSPSLQQTSI